jgi:transcriptional regulator with XRE-family HTH domain
MDLPIGGGQNHLGRRNFEMIDTATIRTKRTAAGIAGNLVCKKLGMARSRLSDVERGYVTPSPEELARIDAALDELIRAKSAIDRVAAALGWPLGVRHDQ